jgi:hypothetical protein
LIPSVIESFLALDADEAYDHLKKNYSQLSDPIFTVEERMRVNKWALYHEVTPR